MLWLLLPGKFGLLLLLLGVLVGTADVASSAVARCLLEAAARSAELSTRAAAAAAAAHRAQEMYTSSALSRAGGEQKRERGL